LDHPPKTTHGGKKYKFKIDIQVLEKENGLPACLWDKRLSNNCACLWQVFCALFLRFIGRCLIPYHQASDNLKVLAQLKSLLGRYFLEA